MHKELFINLEQDQYLKKPYRHADAVLLNSADFEKQTLINHADFILNQLKNTDVSQSKLINKTHQFFTVLEHQFLIKPVSKHTLQHFYFMHFTHELVMRSAPYPKLLSHSFKCLLNNIVSILNILTCQQSTIDFRHSIWRTLSRNCSDFDSAFTDYFINSKKQYKQLWYYINIEIESYKHHPDTVYDGISDHLLQLKQSLGLIMINQFSESDFESLTRQFSTEWKANKWFFCCVEECYRQIWFSYLKNNRIPKIELPINQSNLDQLEFSLGVKNSLNPIPYEKKLMDIMTFFEDKLQLPNLSVVRNRFEQRKQTHDFWHTLLLSAKIIFKQLEKSALLNDYKPCLVLAKTTHNKKNLFKFIKAQFLIEQLQFFACFIQYQRINKSLKTDPSILKQHVVKLERSFFQNRATPKTREWIVESMSQSKFYEEYNLSFLKKIIAKRLIYLCLSTRELTKTNTPEIFAWDLSLIKSLQRQCTNVIQTHLIIEQTKYYFQQYNVTNSSVNWSEIQNKHVTKDQLISLITEKSKLTTIDAHQYLEYIKNTVPNNLNENHDILSNISDLLLKYTTGPICPPANDIMFPITDLFILINHLAFTYKPSLKHYYQKITNDYLINLIFNDDLKIPSTSNFLLLSNRIIAARCWINQICEALAAMRISRQHMIQKGLLLSEQKSVLPIIHSIPNRLAPLFNSFFSIEPSTMLSTKEHFQKELSIVIQQFINDIFNQYKYDFLTLIEDGLIQRLPLKKTQKNRLLHPFWNKLIDAQKIIKQLDPCKKDSAINHLKSTNFLPTTHVGFIKINRIIYNLTPPSFSLKLESYQMQEPIQLCKKECLSFIQQSMSGHFNYQIKNPIDEYCLIRIKTYFKLIKQKLNQSNA